MFAASYFLIKSFLRLIFFLILCPVVLSAEVVYDPATNSFSAMPMNSEINLDEYDVRTKLCGKMEDTINRLNDKHLPHYRLLQQFAYMLQKVGTPTVLRVLSDLKKNKIVYPEGLFCSKTWE